MTEEVRLERRGSVALLVLNRPSVLNALNRSVLESLLAQGEAIAADPSVRALVLTGEGRAFAAGGDIAEMRGLDVQSAQAFSELGHRALAILETLPIPSIAAVNGFALGGGCELALACDWIYAADSARFGQPEVKLGLIPGFGGSSRLLRRVGIAWAKELVLSGEPIDAGTALRIGLVNRVFPAAELLDAALRAAEAAGERGPLAVAQAKRLLQEGQDSDVRVAHRMEQLAFAGLFASEDRAEGMEAFLKKRAACFRGI